MSAAPWRCGARPPPPGSSTPSKRASPRGYVAVRRMDAHRFTARASDGLDQRAGADLGRYRSAEAVAEKRAGIAMSGRTGDMWPCLGP
ncbi:hypothetical protein Saso_17500 [Streptomyces asoensis]|uniref:Uncharacterized protein n=1 Tax=Streptomyces asoensis TaxID=249586 RepID=A0ABQ3RW53_9ACTN|nr:hypothetical protein GCM10010496_35470 [Streptomyces asoensis]GHI60100.1 hypothetical protein Saso_17500 [Streptomyces asoensis]